MITWTATVWLHWPMHGTIVLTSSHRVPTGEIDNTGRSTGKQWSRVSLLSLFVCRISRNKWRGKKRQIFGKRAC